MRTGQATCDANHLTTAEIGRRIGREGLETQPRRIVDLVDQSLGTVNQHTHIAAIRATSVMDPDIIGRRTIHRHTCRGRCGTGADRAVAGVALCQTGTRGLQLAP